MVFTSFVYIMGLACFIIGQMVSGESSTETGDQVDMKDDVDKTWNLCTTESLEDSLMWPTVGNGHVATVVRSDRVFMNGLYNGHGTDSTRARIPAFTSLRIQEENLNYTSKKYCLHMKDGMFTEYYIADHWSVEITWYAHQTIPSLLVVKLQVQTDGQQDQFNINLAVNHGNTSEEIEFTNSTRTRTHMYIHGRIKVPETNTSGRTPVHVYYDIIPDHVTIEGGMVQNLTCRYLMSVNPDHQTALDAFNKGKQQQDFLEVMQAEVWHIIWENGRVDIHGNPELASAAYSALYYIISSMPIDEDVQNWPFIGLSPGDLGHGPRDEEYKGHVFWDQDIWMFPAILVLYPGLSKTLIRTRIRTLDTAYTLAEQAGYQGAKYPWESAFTGVETCPAPQYGQYEIHVTGDVAMAARAYLMMTRDTELLKNGRLKEEILGIADFWKSRATYNKGRDTYEIYDVMPPDEWNYPVNNSAYTNAVAKLSLLLPKYALGLLGEKAPDEYEAIAERMYIPLDHQKQYHPEYDGYTLNLTVKQADVILLGFPLELEMPEEQRRNDLLIYANVTPWGPAMTWSMFCIGWLELNDLDLANQTFHRQLLNKQPPFNVWSEYADGTGAKNFITGQGGFLQSILYGYGGLRLREDRIHFNCSPLPQTEGFSIKDMDYLGSSLDVTCGIASIKVTLRRKETALYLTQLSNYHCMLLHGNKTLTLRREAIAISDKCVQNQAPGCPANLISIFMVTLLNLFR